MPLTPNKQTTTNKQGRRHEVLFGRDGFIGTQTHLPQKFSFSSDFGHFILKIVDNNAKFSSVSRKNMLKYHHFWGGDVPRWFFDCGGRVPPVPPTFDAHANKQESSADLSTGQG